MTPPEDPRVAIVRRWLGEDNPYERADQLLAELDAVRCAQSLDAEPWVRVNERQPRPLDPVIGYDEFYNRIGEACYTGRKDDSGEPRFAFIDSDDCHITHWMPMPKKPAGGSRK